MDMNNIAKAASYDWFIGGWYLTCKDKGYTIFCLNWNDAEVLTNYQGSPNIEEDYCLYVDKEMGELKWWTKPYL